MALLELGIWVVAYAITYLQKSPEIFIAQSQPSLSTAVVSINQSINQLINRLYFKRGVCDSSETDAL